MYSHSHTYIQYMYASIHTSSILYENSCYVAKLYYKRSFCKGSKQASHPGRLPLPPSGCHSDYRGKYLAGDNGSLLAGWKLP